MTDKDKNTSIEYILSQGFVKPLTTWDRVTKMHRVLGWKFIFWDLSYSLTFVFVTLLGIIFLYYHAPINDYPYAVAVGFSPILFLLIMLFAEMNERACGLYQLKQTCLYTSRQITTLRCIYYSVVGIVFAVCITAFSTDNATQFFSVLPLCLAGLFLCAAMKLTIIRWTHSKWAIAVSCVMWLLVNIVLPLTLGERWEIILSSVPIIFTIIFAMASVAVFMYQTNKMLTEENSYAIA